jgi:alkyl sulfatase BDS1-like metallo-beta-lactamase superfamily hydrolase
LKLMNEGAPLDEVVHSVMPPADLLAKPYLKPIYDEPEFIVRNLWRLYGGWYDGDPAHLKPAPAADVAKELGALAGAAKIASRAKTLAEHGNLRLASHLIEIAAMSRPDDNEIRRLRTSIYEQRAKLEPSTMSKGVFSAAAREGIPDDG